MNRNVIRLSSVTYAIRANKMLYERGIRNHIKKFAENMNINGCGYGIEISGDVEAAKRILENAGIRIVG